MRNTAQNAQPAEPTVEASSKSYVKGDTKPVGIDKKPTEAAESAENQVLRYYMQPGTVRDVVDAASASSNDKTSDGALTGEATLAEA